MKKIPKSFKLSQATLDHLAFIVATTGVNQTAAVEMAIAEKAISLRGKPAPKKGRETNMYSYRNQNRKRCEGGRNGGKYAGTSGGIVPIE